MPTKPASSFTWLGKYLSMALVLPSSVVAGYFMGSVADHYWHHPILRAAGIFLGMTGGIVHVFQELSRDSK
jgi:hypothetical protein